MYFQEQFSFETRCLESSKLQTKYEDRVPIVIQPLPGSKLAFLQNSAKVMPRKVMSAGQFQVILRKRILAAQETPEMKAENALFYFVDISGKELSSVTANQQYALLCPVELLSDLYKQFVKPDGFLYLFYDTEKTFG